MLADHETGLLLSGGGARAAYQVGALRAVARILGRDRRVPFPVICGTSAGAINAAAIAVHADDFRQGVARLLRLWRRIDVESVYEADFATVSKHGLRWLAAVVRGGTGPQKAVSMLDNAPLRRLLTRRLDLDRLDRQVKTGALRALGINATSYTSGTAITFYQGSLSVAPWRRARRRGVSVPMTIAHLMASTAIPFIFPAVKLGRDWYMDGSVRQISPLAPALHLGARRVLVIAVGRLAGPAPGPVASTAPRYPSFAQTAGHALTSIFLDNLSADLERMMQINRVVSLAPPQELARRGLGERHVDAFVLAPSADISELALRHAHRLPGGVRALLRGLGGTKGNGAALTSYLLFDPVFCRALLALGYADAMARRDELEAFLGGASVNYLPLPPPEFD